jgi:hypothetical protein
MKKLENFRNHKIHFAKNDHETLCGMSDDPKITSVNSRIMPDYKPDFRETDKAVNCKLCLKKAEKLNLN